jgi:uncharacterized ferritin-like protein (DUF455 family)
MEFFERYYKIEELETTTYNSALLICQNQKSIGDFHLKTLLGFISSEMIILSQYFNKKKKILDFGFRKRGFSKDYKGVYLDPLTLLDKTQTDLIFLIKDLSIIKKNLTDLIDIDIEDVITKNILKFKMFLTQLKEWIIIKPSGNEDLLFKNGLYRDCFVFDYIIPSSKDVKFIRDSNLKDSFTRAIYLSANAYLEITSVDIISDMIYESNFQKSFKYTEMTYDLARQLNDESKHAEILADRVIKMGFDLGIAPIHLQTWLIYKNLNLISEKIVAQQVLQEGVGLDSSAGNIIKMLEVGDSETANVYTQITSDEKNHVALGLKWYHNLDSRPLDPMIEKITSIVNQYYVLPKVPIVPELRKLCGFSDAWIEQQIKEKGSLDLTPINNYIYKKISNGRKGISKLSIL